MMIVELIFAKMIRLHWEQFMHCVFNRMMSICFCDFNWAITVTNLLVDYLRHNEYKLSLDSMDHMLIDNNGLYLI
jgi:hypothetical protein